MEFGDFCDLFKSFYIHMRKDLKDLFDRYAILVNSKDTDDLNVERTWQRQRRMWKQLIYSEEAKMPSQETQLTRNCLHDELKYINAIRLQLDTQKMSQSEKYSSLLFEMQNQILIGNNSRLFYDLLTANSISPYSVNCASDLLLLNYYSQINPSGMNCIDSTQNREFYAITLKQFREFVETEQTEKLSDDELEMLIERHEPNPFYRSRSMFSFVGFAKYLLDKENYIFDNNSNRNFETSLLMHGAAITNQDKQRVNKTSPSSLPHLTAVSSSSPSRVSSEEEKQHPIATETIFNKIQMDSMDYPLSFYYIASSHNTYLTGHQLKGESSAEIYRTALKSGCRCVELDVWDGDDGWPVVYHGRTLTSKVSFKTVVEVRY